MTAKTTALILSAAALLTCAAKVPTAAAGGRPTRDDYQNAWSLRAEDFGRDYRSDGELRVEQIAGPSCNIVYQGDEVRATVCFRNETQGALSVRGRFLLVPYTYVTRGDDVFDLGLSCQAEHPFGEVCLELLARGTSSREIVLPFSAAYGTCALLFECGEEKRRLFVGSFSRIIKADIKPGLAEYRICMDQDDPEVIARLHTPANRVGVPFIPSDDPACEAEYARIGEKLRAIHATGYPICVEFGAGPDHGRYQPLGRKRPHLGDDGVMLDTKSDMVWLPSYDAEFGSRVKKLVKEFGYPKGPVNALMLWNEPWAGISISGWGADDLRYREIYMVMCEAAEEAMSEDPSIHVLLGGADSSSNTFDKLFGDGKMTFLKWMDFMSLHYQGLEPSNPRFLRDRVHKNGRTRFWDTESWVANSPDRVPSVLAAMLAAGHDRLVGIQGNAVVASPISSVVDRPDGRKERIRLFNAWPVAPALAAFQHFIGNRKFNGVVWAGLPWLYEFQGEASDDLTYVVCGDIGPAIDGRNRIGEAAFWTVRSKGEALRGTMTLASGEGVVWYDACGNVLERGEAGKPFAVKLDDNGTYLKSDGTPGSAARLKAAVRSARIDGLPVVAPALRDATAPIKQGTSFGLELRNLTNRKIAGGVKVESPGLTLDVPSRVTIEPGETKSVSAVVRSGEEREDNTYPFKLTFVPDDGPVQTIVEKLHCNVIGRTRAIPQVVESGAGGATMMEKAWLPMVKLAEASADEGLRKAIVWLTADDGNFYFSARVKDTTPDAGMKRFATRDEDADFYPEESIELDAQKTVSTLFRNGAWTSRVNKMAFDVDFRGDVALEFTDDDSMLRRTLRISVNGKADVLRPFQPQSRFTFAADGKAHVEIETMNWLKPQLVAITLGATRLAASDSADPRIQWVDHVERIVHRWPDGVRRYSYRRRPELPCGQNHDNIQIAFNVLPDDAKPWYPAAPGMFKGYSSYWDSDYVFDLNPVAPEYGGGTEVWRERAPNLPNKHYFPHAANGPGEGAVTTAKLEVRREGDELVYTATIPFAEMPEVGEARCAGRPVKFSCRINDNAGGAISELAYRRSVSRRNLSFKPDWAEHWSNELLFNWEDQ